MKNLIFFFIILFSSCGTNEVPKEFISTEQVFPNGKVTKNIVVISHGLIDNGTYLIQERRILEENIYKFKSKTLFELFTNSDTIVQEYYYWTVDRIEDNEYLLIDRLVDFSSEENQNFVPYRKKYIFNNSSVTVMSSLGGKDFKTVVTYLK